MPQTPGRQDQEAEASASPSPTSVFVEETPSPEATPAAPVPDTAATQEPTKTPGATPTNVPTDGETESEIETPLPTPLPTATPTPAPTVTPTPAPTPEPTPLGSHTVIDDYAYALTVDGDLDVTASGWLESDADLTQGQIAFSISGATVLLIWLPAGSSSSVDLVAAGFEILRNSQTALTFEAVSEGTIDVDGDEGAFGGFVVVDQSGDTLGGGLIGGWLCDRTGFILSVTGSDSTIVQVRFDRVLDGFECAGR